MKLFAFGDSFTYGHELPDCDVHDRNAPPSKYTYSALLAEKYNYQYVCLARGSNANNAISRDVIENLHNISKDDLVIIMWSFPERREFLFADSGYESITPQSIGKFQKLYYRTVDSDTVYLSAESCKEIYLVQEILKDKNYIFLSNNTELVDYILNTDSNKELYNLSTKIDKSKWIFFPKNAGMWEYSLMNNMVDHGRVHPNEIAHKNTFELVENKIAKLKL